MKLKKNNLDILYPYRIEGSWEQIIDCSKEELEELYKQIRIELEANF